jgi:hypothetical protein
VKTRLGQCRRGVLHEESCSWIFLVFSGDCTDNGVQPPPPSPHCGLAQAHVKAQGPDEKNYKEYRTLPHLISLSTLATAGLPHVLCYCSYCR